MVVVMMILDQPCCFFCLMLKFVCRNHYKVYFYIIIPDKVQVGSWLSMCIIMSHRNLLGHSSLKELILILVFNIMILI
jgi:hypothetical protein